MAMLRPIHPTAKTDERDAPVLLHEPAPSVAAMIENSVVRRETERAGATHRALAADGWRQRVGVYFGAAISYHAHARPHGRDL